MNSPNLPLYEVRQVGESRWSVAQPIEVVSAMPDSNLRRYPPPCSIALEARLVQERSSEFADREWGFERDDEPRAATSN